MEQYVPCLVGARDLTTKQPAWGGLSILLSSSSDYLRNFFLHLFTRVKGTNKRCCWRDNQTAKRQTIIEGRTASKYEQIVGHYIGNYYDWIIKGDSHTLKARDSASWRSNRPTIHLLPYLPPSTGNYSLGEKTTRQQVYAWKRGDFPSLSITWLLAHLKWVVDLVLFIYIRSGFLQLIFNLRHLIWLAAGDSDRGREMRSSESLNEPRRDATGFGSES